MVEISLLPKEPEKSKKEKPVGIKAKGVFPTTFLALGILLVLLAAGVTFGIFIYKNARASNLDSLENQISILKAEEEKYKDIETEAKTLQEQLNNLENLLAKHKYWSQVMKVLADYTPNDAQYKSIVCEEKDNKFTVTGYAPTYVTVAELMVSLKKTEGKGYFDKIELDSAKLSLDESKEIKVEFSISFNLKEGALKKPSTTESKSPTEENTVYIVRAWDPQELKVKVGSEVTWINKDPIVHRVLSVDGIFDSGNIEPGKNYKYKFDKKGNFKYYCPIHSLQKQYTGTIIVE